MIDHPQQPPGHPPECLDRYVLNGGVRSAKVRVVNPGTESRIVASPGHRTEGSKGAERLLAGLVLLVVLILSGLTAPAQAHPAHHHHTSHQVSSHHQDGSPAAAGPQGEAPAAAHTADAVGGPGHDGPQPAAADCCFVCHPSLSIVGLGETTTLIRYDRLGVKRPGDDVLLRGILPPPSLRPPLRAA
ncbi:MAG: hypothetical protein RLY86_817 [Pseudomonadota bacterium]|jgi:hypothetical protein